MMPGPPSDRASVHRHPLAPLTAAEISEACQVARSYGFDDPDIRFVWCALEEPAKQFVVSWDGQKAERRVTCAIYHRAQRRTVLATVSLGGSSPPEVLVIPQAQPQMMSSEAAMTARNIKSDPRFRAALGRRGITDMSSVFVEPWPAGNFGLDIDNAGRRLSRAVAYVFDGPGDNPHAHPVENIMAIVDLDTGEVIEVQDGDVVPVPAASGRYGTESTGSMREMSALEIRQPDGPGFTLDDGDLRWGPWRMRISCIPSKASSSTRSALRIAIASALSSTAPACRRWWCPTARRRSITGGKLPLTPGTSGSAGRPDHSTQDATASAKSSTWMR